MKKHVIMAILGLIFIQGIVAVPVLAHQGNDVGHVHSMNEKKEREIHLSDKTLERINSNEYVQALTKGYEAVALEVDELRLVVYIEDDMIVRVVAHDESEVDYTIATTKEEILNVYEQREELTILQMIRILVLDKDVPMTVIWRFARMFMG